MTKKAMESIIRHHVEQQCVHCNTHNAGRHDEATGLGGNADTQPIVEPLISTWSVFCAYATVIISSLERPSASSSMQILSTSAAMGTGRPET